uniref:Protein Ycf2 n=1 Tax=Epipremnum aureum TaxID=78380 RepID=A0A0M5IG27_9ARAE|nr:photosystem I assembly protein Ycf2 [Epipremnum aureum]YP_009166669.1 photosystem I assembly protein Ycf2 [Epipremnum aureum]ALB38626.1 photosystem I assembly protein Ycf2 [Epipremnum aureum]ALB38647.1 photosystem I assembly protein Ycf2 [Epipremnum aureum]
MNRNRQFKFWTLELREIYRKNKNSREFLYSWIKFGSVVSFTHIFFHQERFMKLFDPRVLGILLSRDSRGSTRNRYFTTIKGVVLLVVAVLIFRINNQKMVERKNLYLMELLPIPTNSIGPANDTLEESFLSSNINRLIVSLLYLPKRKRLSEDPHESTWVLPINQKCIMPESNRGSRWWSNRIRKKRDSSCKISNETVVGIEISFKEKDSKYLEFLFLSYTPIRKDPDWELFYRFSPRKKRNIINSNSPFEILGKDMICYLMPAFREKRREGFFKHLLLDRFVISCLLFVKNLLSHVCCSSKICYLMPAFREKRREGFFKQQGAEATIQSEHVSHLFLFSRNKWEIGSVFLFSRNKWDISLQNCAQFHMWQFRQDLFVGWNKNRHESDFLRNLIWLDDVNVWLVNKDRFFSKLRNVLLNIQYDSTRSISVQVTDSRRRRRSSHQFRDFFDSIRNEDSKYHKLIDQTEILWNPSTERTEIETEREEIFLSSIRNEDSKYHKLIDQTEILWNPSTERTEIETEREKRMNNHLLPEEIEEFLGNSTRSIRSFFSDKWSELHLGSTRDQKFLKKKQDVSFVPSRRSENKKMVDIFKIIKYLQNTVSIHPISSDPGCDMVVPKDSEERYKKMANLFILDQQPIVGSGVSRGFAMTGTTSDPGCAMVVPKDSEERFKKMANLFILSITESDLVYRRGFAFSIDSSGLTFLNRARDESKNQSCIGPESKKKDLLVLPPLIYEENESFYRRIIEKSVRIYCGNYLEGPKLKIVVFASIDIMEAVYKYKRLIIQYIRNVLFRFFLMNRSDRNYVQMEAGSEYRRLIRNLIQIQYSTGGYIRYVLFRFFLMNRSYRNYEYGIQKDQIGNDTLNHITIMKYMINSNLKKSQKKWFDPLFSRTERCMNRDPNTYRYKRSNGSKNFQEHLEHFLSEQRNRFQVVFDQLRININQFLIDYTQPLSFFLSVVFDQLRININQFLIDYTQPLSFFLSKILHLFFMSVRNISIHRSRQIYIYELNRTNDQLCNQLLESIGAEIIHLNKMKSDDRRTSQRPKFLNSERIRLPCIFNKIPKWTIDSFHIRFIKIPSLTVHTRDTRNNRRKSLFNPVSFFSTYDPVKPFRDNTDSYFSTHDRDNWLNPVKPFHRGPLVYAFYKASRPGFLNNPHFLWFCYCNKGFPFHVEKKTRINNYDFTYRQLLHTLFIRHKIFSLCIINKKKKNIFIFGGGEAVLPIDLKVSDIFISNYFPKSGNETYNLYKSFYVPTIPDPFVRIGIYLIADISSTPLTEKEMANFERTSCQPFSDMDLSGKNLCQYLSFNSNRGLIHTPCYKKLSGKRKKWSLCLKKCVENQHEKQQIYRTLQRDIDSALSNRSKRWNLFKTYMPWLFTSTGFKYLYFTLLDAFSDSLLILSISIRQKFVPIFHDIMHRLDISLIHICIRWKRRWMLLTQCSRISKISSKCLQKLLLYEETIHKNNESPFPALWPLIRSVNIQGLIYEILFLLIFVGYLININLLVFSRAFSELQTELEKIKFFFIPSYMIELEELLDKYPISISKQKQQDSYEDEDSFIAVFENGNKNFFFNIINLISNLISNPMDSYEDEDSFIAVFENGNKNFFFNIINLISNLISNPISFWINTRHLSRTSKEIYAWIRKRKKIYDYAIEDILFSPIGTSDLIDDIPSLIAASDTSAYEYQFYNSDFNLGSIGDEYKKVKRWSQLYNLTIKNRIDQILLSLTHSDRLSKNESGYQMIEQPGSIYLGYLVDIHKKYLMDYKFNRSCLAERRIFLAHYQTITYSQTSRGANSFRFPSSHGKPFSLRLSLSPSRGILVIGSKGTGRSYLVKSLATNSYLPFITISTYRFPNYRPQGPYMEFIKKWNFLYKLFRFVFRDSYDCDSPFSPAYYNSNYFYEYERTEDFLDPRQIFYDDSDNIDDDEVQSLLDALKLEGKSCLKIHLFIFCFSLQFELAKAISPCIIWIPDIHDLYMDESDDLSLGLLANSLSMNCESHSTNLVIASTHIPKKVDPALIAPNKSNTCIKVRRLLIPQRRKHLFTLLYTKGFHLEKEKQIKGFESMPVSSSAQDLVALTNEAISISMAQRKSIIETDTIRLALHRQTHVLRARVRPIEDHGIIFYQIGRAVVQNVLLNNCLIDPISIYMKKRLQDDFLYKWYFELGTSMKKLTILLYLLSCSAGQVAQDLWSPPGPDETSGRTSSGFVGNDSDLVHGLLELEDALVGSSRKEKDCSQFDNNPLFLRSEPRNPLDIMKNKSCRFRLDIMKNKSCRFQYENNEYGTGFAGEEDGDLDQQEKEDYLLIIKSLNHKMLFGSVFTNHIVWAPRIWRPWYNLFNCFERFNESGFSYGAHEENESMLEDKDSPVSYLNESMLEDKDSQWNWEFFRSESEQVRYQMRDMFSRERGFFREIQFIWEPEDPLFFLFKDQPIVSAFSRREIFSDEEIAKGFFLTSQINTPLYLYNRGLLENTPEIELLIHRQRRLGTNSSLFYRSFRSNTILESYQYLSNLFLSNRRLLDQITRTLLRKGWLFPDEIQHLINNELNH